MAQTLPPAEIIVVRPRTDTATEDVIRLYPEVIEETVGRPSYMDGLTKGTRRARGHVVCLIDDDAVPAPDWIERLAGHFADPDVGAVGGRDRQPGRPSRNGARVGVITPWGKLVGNHAVGEGEARDVQVLKGVNMAFRRDLLALPVGLRGGATQDHFEVSASLWVLRSGARVVYDPCVGVDHYPAPRADGTRRFSVDPALARASAYNLVYSIVSFRPRIALRRALFGMMVGDRGCPGLARAAMAVIRGDRSVSLRLWPSLRGQADALWQVLLRGDPLLMRRVSDGVVVSTRQRASRGPS